MDFFNYSEGRLFAEGVEVAEIVRAVGTPCYIYSRKTLERHWHAFDDALTGHPHLICYAVKANSNIAVLNLLAKLGSGFDIVSVGELERVLKAGGDPDKVVFSGVGKRQDEMRRALLTGIRCFNVESEAELECLDRVAQQTQTHAPVSVRVNPDVDTKTHPYIATGLKENKFGIDIQKARGVYRNASKLGSIEPVGISCHIGSQLTELAPFVQALTRMLSLVEQLVEDGIHIKLLDLGGGLGIRYRDETPPSPAEHARAIFAVLKGSALELVLEPGRAILGNAGLLVTRVEYLKHTHGKSFAIVDAAMNDLMRPTLYDAWQDIIPVIVRPHGQARPFDVVGPVCETGDFLGKDRVLNLRVGDLLAVRSAGAYGFSMSSNYNSRPRPAEVMADGERFHLIRARESVEQLMLGERLVPDQ